MRLDRLQAVTDQLADQLDAFDPTPYLDPKVATALDLLRRLGRIDLAATVRQTAATWLRSLPSSAAADPERSDEVAAWAAAMLAWLRGATDDPPPELTL